MAHLWGCARIHGGMEKSMTNDQDVQYGDSAVAARAIHSSLSNLGAPAPGHKVTEVRFTWTAAKLIETLSAYEGAVLLFTLVFTWNVDSTLQKVVRT